MTDDHAFDAADAAFSDLSGSKIETVILHGPPRSIRGRLRNRLRVLFGRDPQDELIAVWDGVDKLPVAINGETLTIRTDRSGTLYDD